MRTGAASVWPSVLMRVTQVNALGTFGVFLLFGCMTLVALAYFWREVPGNEGQILAGA